MQFHLRLNDFNPDCDATAHFLVSNYDTEPGRMALLVTIFFENERTNIRSTTLEPMTHVVLTSLLAECSKLLNDIFDPEGHSGIERVVSV